MQYRLRPLPTWPYPPTEKRRVSPFRRGWSDTLLLLEREMRLIGGSNPMIGAGFREYDLRQDGLPRKDAAPPSHPGVELSFDSEHGRLVYATDVCTHWEDNVRSIALGLEALRAVDRFGISRRGEQYAGFLKLEMRGANPTRGAELVKQHGGLRRALMRTHPDQPGGDARDFQDVQAYRESSGASM